MREDVAPEQHAKGAVLPQAKGAEIGQELADEHRRGGAAREGRAAPGGFLDGFPGSRAVQGFVQIMRFSAGEVD